MKQKTVLVTFLFVIFILFFFLYTQDENRPVAIHSPAIQKNTNPYLIPRPLVITSKVKSLSRIDSVQKEKASVPMKVISPMSEEEWTKIKKRRWEIRGILSSSYTALKAFHAEYERYSTDLNAIGWRPAKEEFNYKFGFLKAYQSNSMKRWVGQDGNYREDSRNMNTDEVVSDTSQRLFYDRDIAYVNLGQYLSFCEKGCTAGEDFFELMVVMPINDLPPFQYDVWTINEKRHIKQVVDGTGGLVRAEESGRLAP